MISRSKHFSSFHLQLHYKIFNEGQNTTPIVCVHGFLDHGGTFLPLVPTLAKKHPVVLLDRRGYGDSQHLPHGRYHFFANLLDIAELIDQVQSDKVILMGHSIGGLIALLYAGAYPQQIERLILLESFGIRDDPEKSPERVRNWVRNQRKEKPPPKLYESVEAALDQLRKVHSKVPDDVLQSWGKMGIRENEDGTASFKSDLKHKGREPILFREDLVRAHAKQIQCPVLAIRGTDSLVKAFPNWLDDIQNIERREMAGGHMCHLEKSEDLSAILKSFLKL
jgi:pimeloyl-ACP methyl ester carboxylesterase